ncbi:MAG: phospholipase D family protein [Pseudomonadota bacterium]|nr:phospholipase D family protein [Pseudomonadota bacterium]
MESKILSGSKIKDTIKNQVKPHRIAVAYLGKQWENWINIHELEEIIVAPIFGTNPYALKDLIEKIEGGLEDVHLLESLHAKIYIGKEFALIGSCNLSNNALSGENLEEVAYLISDKQEINELNQKFNKLKELALATHGDQKAKMEAIEKLQRIHEFAEASGLVKDESEPPADISEQSEAPQFTIAWYETIGPTMKVKPQSLQSKGLQEQDIEDYLDFSNKDEISPGEWILAWGADFSDESEATEIEAVSWFHTDGTIKNCIETDSQYRQYCYQLTEFSRKTRLPKDLRENARPRRPPFELNDITTDAIKEIILEIFNDEKHPLRSIIPKGNKTWRLPSKEIVANFHKAIQEKIQRKNTAIR